MTRTIDLDDEESLREDVSRDVAELLEELERLHEREDRR